jgi:type I restriction enzyme, S subunit
MKTIYAHLDYETSEHAGAGGMFQVLSLTDENDQDITELVDQGVHYSSLRELEKELTSTLKEAVTVEEV